MKEQEEETEPDEDEVTQTPTEKVTPTPVTELVQVSESSVVIRGSVFYPETLELNKGETLVWKNLNKPKRSFTLTSDDELFGDQTIGYGRSFSYTFDEAGDYIFKLKEAPETELVVTVE
jgi:plastocyanin